MKERIVLFTKRPFVRNVVLIATGTAAAQGVTMAFAPFITRIYGAEAFGILGVFTTLFSFLTPVAAGSFPIAIVLPREDSQALALTRLSVYLTLGFSLLLGLLILLFDGFFTDILNLEKIGNLIFLLPIAVLSSVFLQILHQWLIRLGEYKIISSSGVIQAIIINCSKLGMGIFLPTASVLIFIAAIGSFIHSALLWKPVKEKIFSLNSAIVHQVRISSVARKHKDFAYFRSPQILLNKFSSGLPIILLTIFFGPAASGFYALSRSALQLPSQLIGKSVADVFYPRIADASNNNEDTSALIIKATKALAGVAFFPFLAVMIFGPRLFGFVFGEEWIVAGEYSRWLSFWLYFALINKPSVAAIPVLGLQGSFLLFEILSLILRSVALALGFFFFESDVYAIGFFSLAGVVLNITLIISVFNKAKGISKKL